MESQQVTVRDLDLLVEELFQKRTEIEAIEEKLTEANKAKMAIEMKAVKYLKELGRDKYSTPLGTISIRESWKVKKPATPEDSDKLFAYLRERGIFDSLVSINHNTLNAFYTREWEIAKEEGNGFDFAIPGIDQPKLFESLYVLKGRK